MKYSLPEVVRLETSGICNLRCKYCPTGQGEKKKAGVMDDKTFEVVMANLTQGPPRVAVMYHGGEPLLDEKLSYRIRRLKDIGVGYIKVTTSGMLLTEETARNLVLSGLDCLEVSIDGRSPLENDLIRKGSNCDRVIENVKRLIEIRETTPFVLIMNGQVDGCLETPEFLVDAFGVKADYQSYMFRNGADGMFLPPYPIKDNYCSFLFETMTIRWNGDVVPCCYDITGKYVIGNVLEENLDEIRTGDKFMAISEGIMNGNPINICQACFEQRDKLGGAV